MGSNPDGTLSFFTTHSTTILSSQLSSGKLRVSIVHHLLSRTNHNFTERMQSCCNLRQIIMRVCSFLLALSNELRTKNCNKESNSVHLHLLYNFLSPGKMSILLAKMFVITRSSMKPKIQEHHVERQVRHRWQLPSSRKK